MLSPPWPHREVRVPPEIIDPLIALLALLGLGTFSLIGLRMFLGYKARRLEISSGRGEPGRVDDLVEELRNEVQSLRGDLGELHERMDFAERLLTRGQNAESPPGKRDA
jgi:hypothetical protein